MHVFRPVAPLHAGSDVVDERQPRRSLKGDRRAQEQGRAQQSRDHGRSGVSTPGRAAQLRSRTRPAGWGANHVTLSQSVSQRSTWSLHTLIFYTSVRWILCILWFLLAGLALQVDSPSPGSSLRTPGRSPTSGWSSFHTPVDSCFRIVVPSLFTYLPSAQILMRTDLR